MPNRLADATSPYLLQHQDNPVDWWSWGEEALEEARKSDRPVLLSIGYAACHWCHVMAHESFESAEIAAQMNRLFVNIKLDREERPDLDQIFQHALALLGQPGGWPLTMFLTPDGLPFWGGTYFPPEPRWGRPGLPQVLDAVAKVWRDERPKALGNREALAEALARLGRPEPGPLLALEEGAQLAHGILREVDGVHGGIGGAPKFPQAPALDLLWRYGLALGDRRLQDAVLVSLARMCQGGIYDHLGGGFSRYAVDAVWLVPHFEKMLYDNALLLSLLARAHVATRDPLFRARAEETVDWLVREMMVEGAFASSLDADSEGEEGRYYLFDAGEIDALLGADAPFFREVYAVEDGGNFEGRTILNRLHEPGLRPPAEEARLAVLRARLLARRAERVAPARDDKVLADWNGLMIAALAEAGALLGRPDWIELARSAFAAVLRDMTTDDRLCHAHRAGRSQPRAFLDDYAAMSLAALALHEHGGDAAALDLALRWAARADRDLADPAGGYFQAEVDPQERLVRAKLAHDGPTPAANAMMVEVLARLHLLGGEPGHRVAAERAIAAFAGEARRNPFAHAGLFAANLMLQHPVQIVLLGMRGAPDLEALRRAALDAPLATRLVTVVAPGETLAPSHPAAGKAAQGGRATAYVCVGPVCQPPVVEPEALGALLADRAITGAPWSISIRN